MVVVVSYRREERYQNEFSFCFFLTMTSLSPKLSFEAAEKKASASDLFGLVLLHLMIQSHKSRKMFSVGLSVTQWFTLAIIRQNLVHLM